MSLKEFLEQIMHAQTYEEALNLGLTNLAREITSDELLKMTDEMTMSTSDPKAGITWGMVNTNGAKGIVYCRHATGLGDRSHRKHGAGNDFTIT